MLGVGDTSIRYYEYDEGSLKDIAVYRDDVQHSGGALLPKRALNSNDCEIARILRITKKNIQPLSVSVPRKDKGRAFQDDLYPDSVASEPALEASAWISGENATPKLIKLYPSNGVTAPGAISATVTPASSKSTPGSKASTSTTPTTTSPSERPKSAAWNKGATGALPSSARPASEKIVISVIFILFSCILIIFVLKSIY